MPRSDSVPSAYWTERFSIVTLFICIESCLPLSFRPRPRTDDRCDQIHGQHKDQQHQRRAILDIEPAFPEPAWKSQRDDKAVPWSDRKCDVGKVGRKNAAPVNRIGAVSPAARSSPRMTPVRIPGNASFKTMRRIVCQRVAPREMLTVRNAWGTARKASSAVLMMTGRVMMDRVSDAARMDVPKLRKSTNNSQAEQSVHDRGNAGEIDDRDPDGAGELGILCIFRKIDRGCNSKRDGEDRCCRWSDKPCR